MVSSLGTPCHGHFRLIIDDLDACRWRGFGPNIHWVRRHQPIDCGCQCRCVPQKIVGDGGLACLPVLTRIWQKFLPESGAGDPDIRDWDDSSGCADHLRILAASSASAKKGTRQAMAAPFHRLPGVPGWLRESFDVERERLRKEQKDCSSRG